MTGKLDPQVFISYSAKDLDLVREIQRGLQWKQPELKVFVATDDLYGGQSTIDGIVDGIHRSSKCLLLVTKNSLKSSWFAFETTLSLEWSEQLGRFCSVMILYGVTVNELPHFALFDIMPKIQIKLDSSGSWVEDQICDVIQLIQKDIPIDRTLPVGNVAHAQAWSHFFGFHKVVHGLLEQRIRESKWYKENPANFPIKIYELISKCCDSSSFTSDTRITKVGCLDPIVVTRAGNKTRPYYLNVYCIQDRGQKYYCIAQYPNVLSAILKMEQSPHIQMEAYEKEMQLARFNFTLSAILHHDVNKTCHRQSRLLEFEGTQEPHSVLLNAIKTDVREGDSNVLTEFWSGKLATAPSFYNDLETDCEDHVKEFDAVIICGESDEARAYEIEDFLVKQRIKVKPLLAGERILRDLGDAAEHCRWIILILTQRSLKEKAFNLFTVSMLEDSISKNNVSIIPIVDDLTSGRIPSQLRWITYIDMRTKGYKERICKALRDERIPLALETAHIPAGNLGYGLAWGYIVNYMKTVLTEFGSHLKKLFMMEKKGDIMKSCPEKMYVLMPRSCKCTGLISYDWPYVEHICSFTRIKEDLGGANMVKSLDIYSVTDDDNIRPQKHYFIGQYPAPVLCLWEMNESRIASITDHTMEREAERFRHTFECLMKGKVGNGLHKKCEIVEFDDSNPDDLRQKLVPILRRDYRRCQ
ncbi:uncharacterized protein LOC117342363 [Pecten maximus]|uniref:uncharacterized protein LOC117342363 n=1 Tax=Pecten maximus TaxID=6579 RepID=UPI0014584522|nr:uncharacterized protein LOC117342363 [Pecten maximus]